MINCELFSHVYFATPPIPAIAQILNHSVNVTFGPKSGLKINVRRGPGSGFKMCPVNNFAVDSSYLFCAVYNSAVASSYFFFAARNLSKSCVKLLTHR